jgi:hypothetical protein
MQTNTLLATSQRAEELRYITEHFRDLQGLRSAPFWAGLLVLSGVAAGYALTRWHYATVATAILLFEIGWLFGITGWYRRQYGVVAIAERRAPSGILSIFKAEVPPRTTAIYGHTLLKCVLLGLYFGPMLFRQFDGRGGQFGLLIVVFILLPRCFFSAPAQGLVRFRLVFSVAGSIAICALYVGFLFGYTSKWQYIGAICTIMLSLDLFDHWLLAQMLGGRSAEVSR